MIFRSSHRIGRLSQLRFSSLGGHRYELLPSAFERASASIGTAYARLRTGNGWTAIVVTPLCCRTYAGAAVSRPKAHTGRNTSAPRKKAATQTQGTSATQSTPNKAPVVVKVKVKTGAKAKPRRKAPPKKKRKTVAKRKPTKPKARLTEKAKDQRAKKKDSDYQKLLKELALAPPPKPRNGAWNAFLVEQMASTKAAGELTGPGATAAAMKSIGAKYREFTPAQREHYNHVANENHVKLATAYRTWIESHTPTQIKLANQARRALKRKGFKTIILEDERQVKLPISAYQHYFSDRIHSGDYKGITAAQATKLIGPEWKALQPADKQKYEELAAQDRARYQQELKTVYDTYPLRLPRRPVLRHPARAAEASVR